MVLSKVGASVLAMIASISAFSKLHTLLERGNEVFCLDLVERRHAERCRPLREERVLVGYGGAAVARCEGQ